MRAVAPATTTLSVVIPCFNEARTLQSCVDSVLAIQVRAITLETQRACRTRKPVSLKLVGIGPSGGGSIGPVGFSLQSSPAGSTQRLRASAFQLSAWKANPLVLCELTVFVCHDRQSSRCL